MKLNEGNYYSNEADLEYCSNSQLKMFQECEYKAMKTLKGEYVRETTDAMLEGSLLDVMLTGNKEELEKFYSEHPEMISSRGTTKGMLKSNFQRVNQMYEKVINDEVAMKYLSGDKQTIFTGDIFGMPFKAKLDCFIEGKAIVDLKSCESIRKAYWDPEQGRRVSFVEYFKYHQQMAIYQELVRQNTGKFLPCYILAVSKEPITDIELIYIDNQTMRDVLNGNDFQPGLANTIESVRLLKSGEVEPIKCGSCDLCLSEKKLEKPISWLELSGELR